MLCCVPAAPPGSCLRGPNISNILLTFSPLIPSPNLSLAPFGLSASRPHDSVFYEESLGLPHTEVPGTDNSLQCPPSPTPRFAFEVESKPPVKRQFLKEIDLSDSQEWGAVLRAQQA